jgi:glycosyltransferase involved in cell wall biosynthesis
MPAGENMSADRPPVTVMICAYTEKRWDQLVAAVESAEGQSLAPKQVLVVIDHNDALLERAAAHFERSDVVANADESGLSGARNTGLRHACGDVVAFLDDDARADEGWLEELVAPYQDPHVMGTGGMARADWHDERPSWFPPEFDWVVGCSYRGLPVERATVRNPIGANMSFRRRAFDVAGNFQTAMGRLGTLPLGCEETEFSIRLRQTVPQARIVYVPTAAVDHFVSPDRTTFRYFLRRCVAEGLSKATVTEHVGNKAGLKSERRYVTQALPSGFLHGFFPGEKGLPSPSRSGMIVTGLAATTVGYLLGRLKLVGVASWLLNSPLGASR